MNCLSTFFTLIAKFWILWVSLVSISNASSSVSPLPPALALSSEFLWYSTGTLPEVSYSFIPEWVLACAVSPVKWKVPSSSVTTAYWFPLCAATVCTAVSKVAWVGIVLRHIGTYRTLRMQVPVLRTMKENNRELWERLIMGQLYFRQQEGKGSIPWGRDFVKEMRGMRRTLPD